MNSKSGDQDEQQLIDDIYEIALDPARLEDFVERYSASGLAVDKLRTNMGNLALLDQQIASHAERAQVFLDRYAADDSERSGLPPLDAALAPFASSAAMVMDNHLSIAAINPAACSVFGLEVGHSFEDLPLDDDSADEFLVVMRRLLRSNDGQSTMLHFKSKPSGRVIVFQATKLDPMLSAAAASAGSKAKNSHLLLISTELNWPLALDQTLEEVFSVSRVEREIIRSLVEGQDLKSIADARGRSHETVRTQLRSILQKTGARSQSELVRLSLSLLDVVERSSKAASRSAHADAMLHVDGQALDAFQKLTLPDGRNLDYLVQGDPKGRPVLFSHMGYGLCRWPKNARDFAKQNKLCVISPVRMGFGASDRVAKGAKGVDFAKLTRDDTLALMDALGVKSFPYLAQGNDLYFAIDLAAEHPERVTEIIGIGGRLPLSDNLQYEGMGRWHRFFFSNARHAPHLLHFTAKAAFTLARKIGYEEMFRGMHKDSPADLDTIEDREIWELLLKCGEAMIGKESHAEFAYAVELLLTETDWSDQVEKAKATPTRIYNGLQDPLANAQTLAAYHDAFPHIEFQAYPDAGQLLFYQKYPELLPIVADAAALATRSTPNG